MQHDVFGSAISNVGSRERLTLVQTAALIKLWLGARVDLGRGSLSRVAVTGIGSDLAQDWRRRRLRGSAWTLGAGCKAFPPGE
jgi:hypothetical protein